MWALRNVCAWERLDKAEHWTHLRNEAFSLKCWLKMMKKNQRTLENQSPKQRGSCCCDAFQRLGLDYCLVVRCSALDPDSGVSCQILEVCCRPRLQDCRQTLAGQAGKQQDFGEILLRSVVGRWSPLSHEASTWCHPALLTASQCCWLPRCQHTHTEVVQFQRYQWLYCDLTTASSQTGFFLPLREHKKTLLVSH